MSWRASLVSIALMAAAAVALFWVFQRQIAGPSPAFYLPPEIVPAFEESMRDQKRLADLDPEAEVNYRERFAELETTVGRLRILEHNRESLVRRYELILLILLAASVALVTLFLVVRQSRYASRLALVQSGVSKLAAGEGPVEIGDLGRDDIGRIARMIEETSVEIARDRHRLRALRNLSRWQDAARRHAHEMRTPLSGARLTLDRMREATKRLSGEHGSLLVQAIENLGFELERLGRFSDAFASFARQRPPELAREDLSEIVSEFVGAYAEAWNGLQLEVEGVPEDEAQELWVDVDRDMIRQVLANLCDNSFRALAGEAGVVRFELGTEDTRVRLEVADTGPGIADEVRSSLFEPYVTTRGSGEGMGLGLAISRKILLDHGGDLELLDSSSSGTIFVLVLPLKTIK